MTAWKKLWRSSSAELKKDLSRVEFWILFRSGAPLGPGVSGGSREPAGSGAAVLLASRWAEPVLLMSSCGGERVTLTCAVARALWIPSLKIAGFFLFPFEKSRIRYKHLCISVIVTVFMCSSVWVFAALLAARCSDVVMLGALSCMK